MGLLDLFLPSYTSAVKTAVSMPDDLYDRAERAARRLRRSRSALYADALAEYLDRHHVDDDAVSEALDAVYGDEADEGRHGADAGRRLIDAGAWPW